MKGRGFSPIKSARLRMLSRLAKGSEKQNTNKIAKNNN